MLRNFEFLFLVIRAVGGIIPEHICHYHRSHNLVKMLECEWANWRFDNVELRSLLLHAGGFFRMFVPAILFKPPGTVFYARLLPQCLPQ